MGNRTRVEPRVSCPAEAPLTELARRILPGRTPATQEARQQIVRFCANPAARTLLLRGPVGAGKSTIARLIGYGKRIAPLREQSARELLRDVRFEGPGRIATKSMPWYVEFTVTGLVDDLASSQLYGIKRGAATDVEAGPGVFEKAQVDRRGQPWDGAVATGGVVFLDEIADLTPVLQAKLLPVLSGGKYYWVRGEGDPDYERTFDGIFISATWRPIDANRMRQDLISRLTAHIIDVPPLRDRVDDLTEIVESIFHFLVERHRSRIKSMEREIGFDRAFWEADIEAVRAPTDNELSQLKAVDWTPYGDMRGLTAALERIVLGRESAEEVIRSLKRLDISGGDSPDDGARLLSRLLVRPANGDSVVRHVKAIQLAARGALREFLMANPGARAQVAAQLGLAETRVMDDLRQLDRSRSRAE